MGKVQVHYLTSQTRVKRPGSPSRRPQGSTDQTPKHDKHKTDMTQMIPKRSTALERSVKIFNWMD